MAHKVQINSAMIRQKKKYKKKPEKPNKSKSEDNGNETLLYVGCLTLALILFVIILNLPRITM